LLPNHSALWPLAQEDGRPAAENSDFYLALFHGYLLHALWLKATACLIIAEAVTGPSAHVKPVSLPGTRQMLALSPEASNEIGPKKGQRKGKIRKLVGPASSHLTIDESLTVHYRVRRVSAGGESGDFGFAGNASS
jgi:hypothetical protein